VVVQALQNKIRLEAGAAWAGQRAWHVQLAVSLDILQQEAGMEGSLHHHLQ
jgi:hypothetical protein